MFCEKCGKALDSNAEFCGQCGNGTNQPKVAERVSAAKDESASNEAPYEKIGSIIGLVGSAVLIIAGLVIWSSHSGGGGRFFLQDISFGADAYTEMYAGIRSINAWTKDIYIILRDGLVASLIGVGILGIAKHLPAFLITLKKKG